MAYEFSENIQRSILYFLKSDKDFFLQIVNLVKPDYFEFPAHSRIFDIVKDYNDKYHTLPTDEFILNEARSKLKARENLSDYEDELEIINNLDTSTLTGRDYILDEIERFAKREAMKTAIADSILLIKDERVEEVEEVVRKALLVNRDIDTGQIYFKDFKDRWDRVFNKESVAKYPTFMPAINRNLEGGLGPKEIAMIVAPPGVGKSLFLVNQGVTSMVEGKKVLYVSLEMSEDKIAQRFDSITTRIPQSRLKDAGSQLSVNERLVKFQEEFGGELVIKEFPTGCASVNTIRNLLVQLKNYDEFVPDLLIIDYLELLRPVREIQQEYLAQQRIAEELRGVAVENGFLVWTATQTNRQGRMVKVITDAELGDSYGKIRTCDFAMSLNQTEEEFDNGTMRGYVIKSRNGTPRFIVPMSVDYNTLVMEEAQNGLEI